MKSNSLVNLTIQNGIAELTINSPPLNLISCELRDQLLLALDQAGSIKELRVLILTGTGSRAFCAGSDIKEFEALMKPDRKAMNIKIKPENDMYNRLADFPLPTIAALNGAALGGGLELAACCDIIVAEDTTVLALPEVKLGVFPGSGGTVRIPRRIGEGRAKEMMFTGEPLEAAKALAWGLVNRVVAPGEALKAARELATTIARNHPQPLRLCKQAIGTGLDTNEKEGVRRMLPLIEEAFHGPAIREGVRAFLAKETPRFNPDDNSSIASDMIESDRHNPKE